MSDFSLIETMRFEPGSGLVRLNLHMARLANSTRKLGFPGLAEARAKLDEHVAGLTETSRVRLELFSDGDSQITSANFVPLPDSAVWKVAMAKSARLSSTEPLLRHKTSRRQVYEAARAEYPAQECDEVLLLNEKGEVCEGTITNLFLPAPDGKLLTPPLSSGCLAGVLRTSLICGKQARVERITAEMLPGRPFYLGNSLRGLIPAALIAGC